MLRLSARFGVTLPAAMPTEELPLLDLGPIWNELDGPPGEGIREGIDRSMPFFDLGMGQWLDVPEENGGGWMWVMDVKSPGAYGVRVHFSEFNLPPGAEAMVYDPEIPDNLPSPYVNKGPRDHADFYAWTSWNDTARVEVYFPPAVGDRRFERNFVIDRFVHFYRNPENGMIGYFGDRELPCHLDRTCYSNWWAVGDSVGRMSYPTTPPFFGACSGAMLNHAGGDFAPYFLTARHCMQDISSRLDNLEVYWFYQTSTCNGPAPSIPPMGSVNRSPGCSYILTTAVNDMSLVMIDGTVPRNAFWAGAAYIDHVPEDWNIVGIHHPEGSYKRIAFGDIWDEFDSCSATNLSQGAEIDWDAGLTERGSSGSPLLLTDGRVTGVQSCVENPIECGQDSAYYGRWGSYVNDYPNVMASSAWDDGSENNDSCGAASNLDVFYNGTLSSRAVKVNDEDWYRITVPAFGQCTFRTGFLHADGDVDMALHDGCGGVLASSAGTGNLETITWNNPGSSPRDVRLRVYLYNDTRAIYYLDFSRWGPSAPANDTCSSPQPIGLGTYTGTTTGATAQGSSSCGSSNGSPDVFFALTVPCSQDVVIDTFGSNYDTVLGVSYITCGSSSPALEYACNDDAGGTYQSQVSFPATGGTTFYVRVSGYNGAFGTFNLRVQAVDPAYNSCSGAVNMGTPSGGTYNWNNCAATTDGPPDDVCMAFGNNQVHKDVWYYFDATCVGNVVAHTFGSGWDTKMAVYAVPTGTLCPPGPNSALVCNDDANAQLESYVTFTTQPGQRYLFRMGSYNPNYGAAGRLTATFTLPNAADDVCSGATAVQPGSLAWYTCDYSTEGPAEQVCLGGDGQMYNDRWFSFTPTCPGIMDFNTFGSGVDTRIAVYTGCPGGANTAVACSDDADPGTNPESNLAMNVLSGTTYFLRIGNWSEGASGGLSMNLAFTPDAGCGGLVCDSVDFNNDGIFPDTLDIDDFLNVFGGGTCTNDPNCGDIDFNNDGLFPDTLDVDSLLSVFAGGECL